MAIPLYLAMTAAEAAAAEALPPYMAWMACHFSCYGSGLSNLPSSLPENAMVIVDDCTPIFGHDPMYILEQLQGLYEALRPESFLLDFQRPDNPESACLAEILTRHLPCPVGVTEDYAQGLQCPVFLTAPPLHRHLKDHIAPWTGRELWLEAAVEAEEITVTREGSKTEPTCVLCLDAPVFEEENLHCRYHIRVTADAAIFHLTRQKQELEELIEEGENLGITRAVGLYQQLGQRE